MGSPQQQPSPQQRIYDEFAFSHVVAHHFHFCLHHVTKICCFDVLQSLYTSDTSSFSSSNSGFADQSGSIAETLAEVLQCAYMHNVFITSRILVGASVPKPC